MAAAAVPSCSLLPDTKPIGVGVGVRGRDGASCSSSNTTCSTGGSSGKKSSGRRAVPARVKLASSSTRRVIVAMVPLSYPTKKSSSPRNHSSPEWHALRVDAILATESWVASDKAVASAAAEEAMALARAAAKAASDAAYYAQAMVVENEEFPSEIDLMRLERARLSEMERAYRLDYDTEAALLEAEQSYVNHLEALLDNVSSLVREADVATEARLGSDSFATVPTVIEPRRTGLNVTVRSKRRGERLQRRERALEKAEKVAASIASAPVAQKPRKPQFAQDPSDPIRSYLRDIGKTKLLTAAEEVELSRGIQDLLALERVRDDLMQEIGREPTIGEWSRAVGMEQNAFELRIKEGRLSKDKMVNSNLRLVVSIAKNYQGRGMTLQDLIQEGSMGLIRGAEKFDPTKGFKFSTYAHWWIRQAVTRAIADQSRTIRLPIHLYEVISRINKAKKMLSQEHGRTARDEEVAELVGMTVEKLRIVVKSARAPTSMERPIGKEKDTTIGELVPDKDVESPEEAIVKQLLKQDLEGVLSTLNPREKEVLRLRYGLDDGRSKTLEEIGNVFKVTRERIRQIEAKAMRKLRQPGRNGVLREYLDVKS